MIIQTLKFRIFLSIINCNLSFLQINLIKGETDGQ